MLSAFGVVVLALGAIIEIMDLTTVAVASLCVFFAIIEMGSPFQYFVYFATGFLSLILLPDKFAAIAYILFGGIYPVLKRIFERFPKILSWTAKILYFNLILTAIIWLSLNILKISGDDIGFSIAVYILGNVTFVLYDIAMTMLISFYLFKLRDRFRIGRYFEK